MPARTHGMSGTKIYKLWVSIMDRCYNNKAREYPIYGGRGIDVCERWQTFVLFFEDMGGRPLGLSIERKDNNLGYSPDNCCWATPTQQKRNSRIYRNNKTGTPGVHFCKTSNRFRVRIGFGGDRIQLGMFETIEEAAEARRQGEIKHWGKGEA